MTQTLTLRPRGPEDVLACVPILLGFVPTDSVVVVGVSPPGFCARVDLEEGPLVHELSRSLVDPVLAQGIGRVALCLFGDLATGAEAAAVLRAGFLEAGVEVIDVLGTDGRSWVSWHPERYGARGELDLASHPFVVEAVLHGRVVHGSRAELAEMLAPDPDAASAVAELLESTAVPGAGWLRRTVRRLVETGTLPDPAQVAALVLACVQGEVRDAAWARVAREEARAHLDVWRPVVRAAPGQLVAGPAAVLAFLAWRAGDGALAWCAVERSREGGPCSLADLVAELLERAVPPDTWDRARVLEGEPPDGLAPVASDHPSGGAG